MLPFDRGVEAEKILGATDATVRKRSIFSEKTMSVLFFPRVN